VTVVTRPRPTHGDVYGQLAILSIALLLAVGAALAPWATLVIVLGLGVVAGVALHPPLAASLLIVASLLLAGIDRGVLVPLLRPQEAILVLVVVGLVVHLLVGVRLLGGIRLALRFDRLDGAILGMAFASSVLPLGFMLLRERVIELDDILYALQLWKLYAVFVVVRVSLRSADEVRRCLWVIMCAGLVVGVVGLLQALDLFGVQELMTEYFKPVGENASSFESLTRATSTVGSPFAVGDVMTFCIAIAAGLVVRGHPRRVLLSALAALFLVFAMSSGQFSIAIGVVVAVIAFGLITRRLGRSLVGLLVVAMVAGVVLQPVIQNRLLAFDSPSGLPSSWEGRVANLETFFLPLLKEDLNWVTGVRPAARVAAPENWREYVYMESGHIWLLWTGGVIFLLAFLVFLAIAMSTMARVARARSDAIGVAAIASFTALAVLAVLMVLDVHLTLRGAGEVSFALLALGLPRPRRPEARA
jgi:hypothetical protein